MGVVGWVDSKQLEASLAAMSVPYCSPKNQSNLAADDSVTIRNQEHVELVRRLVMSNIEKEEMENELVRYKML